MSGIRSMYIASSACVRVKGGESEQFRIDSIYLFNVYMDGVMKKMKMGMGRTGVSFMEDGSKCSLPSLLYTDDFFYVVSRRRT